MKQKLLQSNLIIFTLMLFCITSFNTFAQQVKKISVQGFLKDGTGKAVADGNQDITFKLYTTETGGTAAWTGTQTVKVTGGVYSAYLGTATNPIDGLNWGSSTYFVGVTVGTDELTPRTELTFAPYSLGSPKAQEVVCSGAVGDVKYSMLNPQQFATVNGNCWVPMDGRDIAGSKLAPFLGRNSVPDAGGLFLRGQESQGSTNNEDPERSSSTQIGTKQEQAFGSHNHAGSTTTAAGNHDHTTEDFFISVIGGQGNAFPNGISQLQLGGNYQSSIRTTSASGNHFHGLNIAVEGGGETRPKNLNLWTYVRIN